MSEFLTRPNLPDRQVVFCAVSEKYPTLCRALMQNDLELVQIGEHPDVADPLCTHPDMLLHHLGDDEILVADHQRNVALALNEQGFTVYIMDQPLHKKYPKDVLLNAARIANRMICKREYIFDGIDAFCNANHIQILSVSQGYAKCSVCIVDENSILTSDVGIADATKASGMDVLLVSNDEIILDGYDKGFFGGCTGLIDKNKLAFTGHLRFYKEHAAIEAFLHDHNVEPVYLTDNYLIDIGSILPLKQVEK